MRNKKFLLGMLVMVLITVFLNVGCTGGEDGKFVITNIPSNLNGKYITVFADYNRENIDDIELIDEGTSLMFTQGTGTYARVSSGRASTPMYYYGYLIYTGNHTFEYIRITFFDGPTYDLHKGIGYLEIERPIRFSNGGARVSFRDGNFSTMWK